MSKPFGEALVDWPRFSKWLLTHRSKPSEECFEISNCDNWKFNAKTMIWTRLPIE